MKEMVIFHLAAIAFMASPIWIMFLLRLFGYEPKRKGPEGSAGLAITTAITFVAGLSVIWIVDVIALARWLLFT